MPRPWQKSFKECSIISNTNSEWPCNPHLLLNRAPKQKLTLNLWMNSIDTDHQLIRLAKATGGRSFIQNNSSSYDFKHFHRMEQMRQFFFFFAQNLSISPLQGVQMTLETGNKGSYDSGPPLSGYLCAAATRKERTTISARKSIRWSTFSCHWRCWLLLGALLSSDAARDNSEKKKNAVQEGMKWVWKCNKCRM